MIKILFMFSDFFLIFIVHLNAHSSLERETETRFITKQISDRVDSSKERLIIQGDMNSLSMLDEPIHNQEGLLEFFRRGKGIKFDNMRRKFLTSDKKSINYDPILNLLLDGKLFDLCWVGCVLSSMEEKKISRHVFFDEGTKDEMWNFLRLGTSISTLSSTLFLPSLDCMKQRCPFSEPTERSPDWSELPEGSILPPIRLDFMFGNRKVVIGMLDDHWSKNGVLTQRNEQTATLSDHFPSILAYYHPFNWIKSFTF